MQKIKDFFNTPLGSKFERYLWHVGVLTIGILISVGADLNVAWIIFATPLLTQLSKYLNIKYLK